MQRYATFSEDRGYRYSLGRSWDIQLPVLGWIMLNPSTADGLEDDPTIRRCISFARRWGFGSITVANLFAIKGSKPSIINEVDDPVGPDNVARLAALITSSDVGEVICAWGGFDPGVGGRRGMMRDQIDLAVRVTARSHGRQLWCLGETKDGSPKHPLYLPGKTVPVPYDRWSGRRTWPH